MNLLHQHTLGSGLGTIPADVGFLAIEISRREIESGQVGRFVDELMMLSTYPALVARFMHGVAFAVDGYNDDPRDLNSVPEFKTFMRALTKQWPF